MASTSDPPAAGGGEASSHVAAAAVAPSSEPPPPSSSSSKRRWSPCTWRYAIEEVQPDLGSRARNNNNNNNNTAHFSSSARDHAAPPTTSKSRPLHNQDHGYSKDGDEPAPRRSAHGNRTWGGAELSELRARHVHPRAQDIPSKKKRPPHPHSHQQPQQKEPAKRPKEEEEHEDEENEWDAEDGDDAELGHHFEDSKKRKKREMSPSELYYCDLCRAKAAEASKNNNISPDSLLPLQDP